MRMSNHALNRLVQRDKEIDYIKEAKRKAKIAYQKGHNIGYYISDEQFYNYLKSLVRTNTTKIKIYDNLIYIFRGSNKTLVTVHKFPEFMLERDDKNENYIS